ncbi:MULTISPECIES: hypothetical protein [Clostridium]|uniref:Uncharacterized protein n=1 Tax=Clostridium frigoriphilum TaxID=443253 RepID=A0ABU7UI83_9CLOT|nr:MULTISPECIES: hypothetical protein [Clostridium]
MKNKNSGPNENQQKVNKSKEENPVIINGDANMRKPVRGLSK